MAKSATERSDAVGDARIAVAVPCYNEAATIAKVVGDFKNALPGARVYVFDNKSTDGSAEFAEKAGAEVRTVSRLGKGRVMRAIFDEVDADVVVIVDGDDTYSAEDASKLLEPVLSGSAEMAVGNRLLNATAKSLTRLHRVGNRLIVSSINRMFGSSCEDILSGYRVVSRRLAEAMPLLSPGFETETEVTIRALAEDYCIVEIPVSYRQRPTGSESKLRSFRDGYRIMRTAFLLLRDLYPFRLFGIASLCFLLVAMAAAVLRLLTYMGAVVLPTALLTGTVLLFAPLALMAFGIGLSLDAINARFRDLGEIVRKAGKRWS